MDRTLTPDSQAPRTDCVYCRRPLALCPCAQIVVVPNRTGITIVQHPGERDHPFNTARLAKQALGNVRLIRALGSQHLERPPLPEGAAVLYPSPEAPDLADLPADQLPTHLVVLDGTWPQAHVMYRDNPWLQELPHVAISPSQPSNYRIREEPAEHCLSTIESIAAALQICEPTTPHLDRLLDGFTAMIDGQIAERERRVDKPRRCKKTEKGGLPVRLAEQWNELWILHPELAPVGVGDERHLELLQVTAYHPGTGRTFTSLVRPSEPPPERLLGHLELTADELNAAPTLREVGERWRAISKGKVPILGWTREGPTQALRLLDDPRPIVSLKSLVCNRDRSVWGLREEIEERLNLDVVVLEAPGRGGTTTGQAVALARWVTGVTSP